MSEGLDGNDPYRDQVAILRPDGRPTVTYVMSDDEFPADIAGEFHLVWLDDDEDEG